MLTQKRAEDKTLQTEWQQARSSQFLCGHNDSLQPLTPHKNKQIVCLMNQLVVYSVYKQMEFTSENDNNEVKTNYSVEIYINDYTLA